MNSTTYKFLEICPIVNGHSTLFIIKQFPSERHVVSQAILCIVDCFLIFPTAFLNGISVLVIWRNRILREKLCFFLILIQSILDLTVGIISLPLLIYIMASEVFNAASCNAIFASNTIASLPISVSFVTIHILTFERYMGILHPFIHRSYQTKRRMITCCCFAIVLVIGARIIFILFEGIRTRIYTVLILLFLAFNTFAYVRIFFAGRKMQLTRNEMSNYTEAQRSSGVETKRSLRERKLAKSCALAVVISYLCYIPSVLSYVYYKDDLINLRVMFSWSMTIIVLNSSINSIVFFWNRSLFRGEALKVFRKLFTCN